MRLIYFQSTGEFLSPAKEIETLGEQWQKNSCQWDLWKFTKILQVAFSWKTISHPEKSMFGWIKKYLLCKPQP